MTGASESDDGSATSGAAGRQSGMSISKDIPAWKLSASQYCTQQDVKEPWLFEVSPMQLGLMSKRARGEYDTKRAAEWAASGACKTEWRRKVVEASMVGTFDWRNPPADLHPEARTAAIAAHVAAKKADREEAWAAYRAAQSIQKSADVAPGDRVFDLMFGGYVRVVKAFAKGIRVVLERDGESAKPYTADVRRFQRMNYADAKAAFEMASPP